MRHSLPLRLSAFVLISLVPGMVFAATAKKPAAKKPTAKTAASKKAGPVQTKKVSTTRPKAGTAKKSTATASRSRRVTTQRARATAARTRSTYSPWSTPTFADSISGDRIDGEDLAVRRAAVEALGPYNGSVVVVDPNTGRILTAVNQKVAFGSGYQPCSTIKVPVGLAALSEGIIDQNTKIRLYGKQYMDLTEAMARSNNPYFAKLGEQLGFEKVYKYSKMFGLGEKAGLDIPEEQLGTFPTQPIPESRGGVGRMTSFGEGISLTNLQYAAFLSSIANGGTLYYLQYPRNQYEAEMMVPRVKRQLDIAKYLPQIREGMQGATTFGTARRAAYQYEEPVLGKTGTCTEARTHLGWFGSFNDVGRNSLVVVVLLTGAEGVSGPTAAQIAGSVYKNLNVTQYFVETRSISPAAFIRPAAWISQAQ